MEFPQGADRKPPGEKYIPSGGFFIQAHAYRVMISLLPPVVLKGLAPTREKGEQHG